MISETISHYKILEKLGEGGMGVVYKAEDTKLDRTVALKFLPPELTKDSEAKERFIQEAKTASALQHNNVSTIHEIDETDDGQIFICMDFYEGESLQEKIERGPIKIEEAIEIGSQIAEGLYEAHERGIIHRDIKPANIMITTKGQAKIMDFGLAKLRGQKKLTKEGTTVGTVAYMSPEQAQGIEVDQRSDIFSLGVVLYELITGQLPFKGEHEAAVIYSIVNEMPEPMARYKVDVPDGLQRIVEKSVAKEREERYQHIDELLTDLRRERKNIETVKTAALIKPAEAKKLEKSIFLSFILAGLFVLLLVVSYFGFFHKKKPSTLHSGKPSIAVLYLENLSENKEDEYFAAGMTEDIITQLSKIGGLRVASRSDIEQFKDRSANIKDVARELKVDYVMEGSVRKYGNKLRITCQLIQAADGFHAWAESYDRQMEDLFAIQADVAKEVAEALEVALVPEELKRIEKRPTLNMQAYSYYLKGREYYWSGSNTRQSLELSVSTFEKALEVDSNFALAYAGLSDCYSSFVWARVDPKRQWLDKAEKAGLKALALDPDLAEAHRSLSRLYAAKGNMNQAIQAAKKAIGISPNYGEAWRILGYYYYRTGQFQKAESAIMRALEVKPTEIGIFAGFIKLYSLWGKREKVEEYFNKGLEVQPGNNSVHLLMSDHLFTRGELEEAKRMAYNSLNMAPNDFQSLLILMNIFLVLEEADSADYYLERIRSQSPDEDVFVEMARVALMRGDNKQAETYLDSCIQMNQPLVIDLKGLPGEYWARTRMALAWGLKEENEKALQEIERVRRALGNSLLTLKWDYLIEQFSLVYILTEQKEMAMEMLDFLVKNNIYAPAFIKSHPIYRNLAGYPPYEALIKRDTS